MYAPLKCPACAFEMLNISYNRFTGDADRVDTFQQSQRVYVFFLKKKNLFYFPKKQLPFLE